MPIQERDFVLFCEFFRSHKETTSLTDPVRVFRFIRVVSSCPEALLNEFLANMREVQQEIRERVERMHPELRKHEVMDKNHFHRNPSA